MSNTPLLNKSGLSYLWSKLKILLAGKADVGHTHTTANITSGTFDAARIPNLPASKITSGTLPVARGGTGNTSVDTTPTSGSTKMVTSGGVYTALSSKANTSAIPTKTSQLTNDSGFKTTDNNTTYSLSKSGSTITLTGSDGSTTSVTDSNTTYNLGSFGVTATAAELNTLDGITATVTELNYVDGVTSNIQTQLNGKAASSHNHAASNITSGTLSSDRLPTIPITKGGTGATTAAGALTNLGITATAAELNKLDGVTATTSELNYVDGVTSNIQTQLNGKAASSHTHSAATTSAAGYMSSGDKTKLDGIATGATKYESQLGWGNTHISGGLSPIDVAASSLHSTNRLQFAKPAGITIEYSRDGGTTWADYGATDVQKIALVSGQGSVLYIGGHTSGVTINDKLRVTLDATAMGVYTKCWKVLLNISTAGASGSNVIVEKAMKGSTTTFTNVTSSAISGWSGWNSLYVPCAFGGDDTQTSNVAKLRFTFGITGLNSNTSRNNALQLLDMVMIGETYWSTPSNMAKTGHIYSWDTAQNATFPANVTANYFNGNASSATTLSGLTATVAELNYVDGVTSNIQTQLNAKQATISGGASTITSSNLTANRALISNSSGKVAVSAVTSTELGYLDGVTSSIQTQLNSLASRISALESTIKTKQDSIDSWADLKG